MKQIKRKLSLKTIIGILSILIVFIGVLVYDFKSPEKVEAVSADKGMFDNINNNLTNIYITTVVSSPVVVNTNGTAGAKFKGNITADPAQIQSTPGYDWWNFRTIQLGKQIINSKSYTDPKYHRDPAPATTVLIPAANVPGASISFTWSKVGEYLGKEIGCRLTIDKMEYNYLVKEFSQSSNQGNVAIQVSNRFYDGLMIFHVKGFDQKFEFFYTDNPGTFINMENAYFNINSLNGPGTENNEAGGCNEFPGHNESVFMTDEQWKNVSEYYTGENMLFHKNIKSANHNYTKLFVAHSNCFTDYVGGATFTNNSIILRISGPSISYRISKANIGRKNLIDHELVPIGGIWTTLNAGPAQYIKKENDYSIDAACTNCNSTQNLSNRAYVIQDTTEWEAIWESPNVVDKPNVKNYFTNRVTGYFCREEFIVRFPKTTVGVETGRYFTVNQTPAKPGIPNFEPIVAERIVQCTMRPGAITTWTPEQEYSNKSAGTIELTYTENKANFDNKNPKTYDTTQTLVASSTARSKSIQGNIVTYRIVSQYRLKWDVYRYINRVDSKSLISTGKASESGLDSAFKATHNDVGVPNLPISFNNDPGNDPKKEKKAADVTLKFILPSDSTLADAFAAPNNEYFGKPPANNIYNKYNTNPSSVSEAIKDSACAKLYQMGSSEFKACVSERTNNKIGNTQASNCYNLYNVNSYKCPIKFDCPSKCNAEICPDGSCPDEETCKCNLSCKIDEANEIFYGKNGNVVNKATFDAECCPDGDCPEYSCKEIPKGTFYGEKGNIVDKATFIKECDKCPDGSNVCPDGSCPDPDGLCPCEDKCPDTKKCCPDGSCAIQGPDGLYCPNPKCEIKNGKYYIADKEVTKAEYDAVCDHGGGGPNPWDTVYRPMDLTHPFPAQAGTGRNTGKNWCGYNVATKKVDCKSNNPIATFHIQNNRKVANDKLYQKTPLYKFELKAAEIRNIRSYNKSNEYDDFTLNCNSGTCYSTFFRDKNIISISSGECRSKKDLAVCAER